MGRQVSPKSAIPSNVIAYLTLRCQGLGPPVHSDCDRGEFRGVRRCELPYVSDVAPLREFHV
jgi:hypothetical protein